MKAVQRGNLIVLSAFKKKLERAYTSNLTSHLETQELKEANSLKRSRRQNSVLKSTKWKQKELYKESTKSGPGSLRKSTR